MTQDDLKTVAQQPEHIGSGTPTHDVQVTASDVAHQPGAETPVETEGTRIDKNCAVAAGVPGVLQTMRFTWKEMGIARGIPSLLKVNQKDGFDCQSCAWPNPDDERHAFEFCENGVKAVADEATTKRITPEFFQKYSVAELAEKSDYWLNRQGRLTHPMILRDGATHYEPISWNAAFEHLATELRALPSPHAAAFYTSGRASNEAAFLYQLFVRQFGTNNLPDCSNMCHESSGAALNETIGIGKGCVTLADFDEADLIFIIGQNPGTNHPRMLSALASAKTRGCKVVSVNPLQEVGNTRFKNPQDFKSPTRALPTLLGHGASITDVWLQVRINGDLALFLGIMKEMLAAEEAQPGSVFDHEFIGAYTVGYEEFLESVRTATWSDILESSGLTREQIRATVDLVRSSKRIIACWAMGLTQHKNSVATIQAVMNLLFLGGHIGRKGAGPCPVRGHSNVQGDRT
ncbi:MAG TPA: molybdopterin-dependent oxidoreductase, partial [Chthoniobacterales bacterium]